MAVVAEASGLCWGNRVRLLYVSATLCVSVGVNAKRLAGTSFEFNFWMRARKQGKLASRIICTPSLRRTKKPAGGPVWLLQFNRGRWLQSARCRRPSR